MKAEDFKINLRIEILTEDCLQCGNPKPREDDAAVRVCKDCQIKNLLANGEGLSKDRDYWVDKYYAKDKECFVCKTRFDDLLEQVKRSTSLIDTLTDEKNILQEEVTSYQYHVHRLIKQRNK